MQEDTVCDQATATIDTATGVPLSEALVVVRIGDTTPSYLATKRRVGVMGGAYLLNGQFALLARIGGG